MMNIFLESMRKAAAPRARARERERERAPVCRWAQAIMRVLLSPAAFLHARLKTPSGPKS